jgi:hypothetical protein
MAQAVSHLLSNRRPGFMPGSISLGLFDRRSDTAIGFSRSSSVYPVTIIPPWLSILVGSIRLRGMNSRPVRGHSSETWSHPINIDSNNNDEPFDRLSVPLAQATAVRIIIFMIPRGPLLASHQLELCPLLSDP